MAEKSTTGTPAAAPRYGQREAVFSPLDGLPSPRERHVRPEHDDRAHDRRDPPAGSEAPGSVRLRVAAEDRVADEAADEGTDHAEDGRCQPAHVLPARIDGPRQEADDQTENDEANDVHRCLPAVKVWEQP